MVPPRGRRESGGLTSPTTIQRVEAAALAALLLIAAIVLYPPWWWALLALFLVFDLSMLGYLRSLRLGAAAYNLVHSYLGPTVLGALALLSADALRWWCGLLALAWAFHVAADRALGYGLKLTDAFEHTHLGWIGRRGGPASRA